MTFDGGVGEPDYKKAMIILDESTFSTKPFESKYNRLEEALSGGCEKRELLNASRTRAESVVKEIERIKEPLTECDDEGFCNLVDRVEIGGKGGIKTIFKNLL
ncbi:MAG: hypothetical protein SOZ83_01220 [Sphaerochaetaceae bacterium]|nr:hypothetical protein [Sphaerochaetaceae bacterium]